MHYKSIIKKARGEEPADLVIRNARYLNVFTDSFESGDIAIGSNRILGIDSYYEGVREIDAKGHIVVPGFIDAHIHLESTMLTVENFCRTVLPLGTTSVITDPHEIANVLGVEGISYILKSSKYKPINFYVMLPSCVPATPWETSGAQLDAIDLLPFLDNPWVLGIAEMMNYPGLINQDESILDKLKIARNKCIDGHCPQLRGKDLNAYISCNISSDHECSDPEEALEKLSKGMHIFIREGTTSRNLEALLPIVNAATYSHCSFCSDDREPHTLMNEGHVNSIIQKAISLGLDPVYAFKMASYNPARYFGLKQLGAIAPGYIADLNILPDEYHIQPVTVVKNGKVIFEENELKHPFSREKITNFPIRSSVNVRWLVQEDFEVPASSDRIRYIELEKEQLITHHREGTIKVEEGLACSDVAQDLLKIAVIERHFASGQTGKGFIKGFGLRNGAIASSVAHDSHNLIVLGTNDEDMLTAAVEIVKMQGGMCVVDNGKVLARLQLPIAGLMSYDPVEVVAGQIDKLNEAARNLGCHLPHPFLTMAFVALPVIPHLKITDKGLFDVDKFQFSELFL